MADKYKSLKLQIKKERNKQKGCLDKKSFNSKEEAEILIGQDPYLCKYCNKWHRTTKISRLVNYVKAKKSKPLLIKRIL